MHNPGNHMVSLLSFYDSEERPFEAQFALLPTPHSNADYFSKANAVNIQSEEDSKCF